MLPRSSPRIALQQHALIFVFLACAWVLQARGVVKDAAAARAATTFHVDPESGRIQDGSGRERIFHGLNVVVKGSPWHPRLEAFDPQFSFTNADIALLREWGMNVVRLGIMWPGVEPKSGQVNSTYLNVIKTIVRKLHSAGINTLLEFHQDLFSAQFCGEGLPSWIFDGSSGKSEITSPLDRSRGKHDNSDSAESSQELEHRFIDGDSKVRHGSIHYPSTFPEPLGKRWPSDWSKDGWEPSVDQCNKHTWWSYYFSYAVSRAFQDLYENKSSLGDSLAQYWRIVAEAFKDEPGVMGYELMNEPWPGDIFRDPLLLLPGVADLKNLVGFYDKLQAAIRSVDAGKLLFFETITFDNLLSGFRGVPGGPQWKNMSVLSYHYYTPPNFSVNQAFIERKKESKRLGCGSMLTEFFVSTYRKKVLELSRMLEKGFTLSAGDGVFEAKSFADEFGQLLTLAEGESMQSDNSVDGVLAAADAHVQSWIGWEYKAFYNKTGSVVEQSLFGVDGELNTVLAKKLARTYPRAVSGYTRTFSFDPTTSSFFLSYVAGSKCFGVDCEVSAPTEIFFHRDFYYKEGLSVEVNQKCVTIRETPSFVYIQHSVECIGLPVDVKIDRLCTTEAPTPPVPPVAKVNGTTSLSVPITSALAL
ncbi:hypothetical protein R1sor_006841 [Riccia sorocarpa]|uniref:Uncharacterized protein n=1 Tax=Riccia sorocarpa TaxID=122646 RepID=A0ABD3HSE1_9MARC